MTTQTSQAFSIEDFASDLHDTYADLVTHEEARNSAGVRDYVYASGRRKCLRRMVLEMAGAEQSPFNADQLARMRRGKDRERDIKTDLIRLGRMHEPQFEVEGEQQTVEIKGRNGKTVIRGKIEGYLNVIARPQRPKM